MGFCSRGPIFRIFIFRTIQLVFYNKCHVAWKIRKNPNTKAFISFSLFIRSPHHIIKLGLQNFHPTEILSFPTFFFFLSFSYCVMNQCGLDFIWGVNSAISLFKTPILFRFYYLSLIFPTIYFSYCFIWGLIRLLVC